MALPTLSKTWQFNVNNAISALGSALADHRRLLRSIKNALVGFSTNPWVVRYSSDSSVAGTAGDGVDRWAADANLVWANSGTAHSWIVLRQTGVATNFELLISCEINNASGNTVTLVKSPAAAFTGGSTTARPTATDEIVLLAGPFSGIAGVDLATRWSVMQSTDGQCTRVIIANSGAVSGCWFFEKPANTTTGWSNPSASWAMQASPAASILTSTTAIGRMRNSSTIGNVSMLCEGNGTSLIPVDATYGNIANEISSEWPMIPIAIASPTVGVRGRHGTLQDIWLGSNSVTTGDTYPNDASNQFVQFGNIILPWNGGAVNLT